RAAAAGQADRLAQLQPDRGLHDRRRDLLSSPLAAGAAHLRDGAAPEEGRMTILKVSALAKRFGAIEVLRGLDLEVSRGERIAILGASGSGKSTLLRCLNFMELPSAGRIELDGDTVGSDGRSGRRLYRESELTQVRQRVGMV